MKKKKAQARRNLDGLRFKGWAKAGGENVLPIQEEKAKGVVNYNICL
jgi:hypothetical protein